jgi:hypothetical protein
MQALSFAASIVRLAKILGEVARLPVARLHFDIGGERAELAHVYRDFTRPHPRYKIIPNKVLGVALVDLRRFSSRACYLDSVQGKGNGGPQSRKARARGYALRTIDRNDYIDEIHEINVSSEYRQGRLMDTVYREKVTHYRDRPHVLYFGMFNKAGRLVAYCNVALFGNFAGTEQVLGVKNNDGVMYLLFTEIVGHLIDAGRLDYFMYDTVFGAQDGLRDFKRRLGFRPYRARYSIA